MTTLNLHVLNKSKQYIRPLRDKILEMLGDTVFECETKQDFAFEALRLMYPVNKGLENNINSINNACDKLFTILPIYSGTIEVFTVGTGTRAIVPEKDDREPMQIFLETYLQFETSPGMTFKYLEHIVKEDMIVIQGLIKWYESTTFVSAHLNKGVSPRNHEERVLYDFYQRCIKQQRTIIEYYLSGIKKRAIAKANYWGKSIKQLMAFSERYRDRPYHFATYRGYAYYDCRKIDLIANKVADFPMDSSRKLENLYENNKTKFYRLLFKKHDPAGIFQEFKFYLAHLPLANDRTPIFRELEVLLKRKNWIGYYSLALTQVEGLFSEMYEILNASGTSGVKSLPDKVQYARDFHEMSDTYFDYYQYHIPRLRNKFMHTGYDEDFKLKSFDLLFDLWHLLKIFSELNNPFVKIKRLHTRRNYEDFIACAEFATYFGLLNKLSKKQKEDIDKEIKDFELNFLVKECSVEYICLEIADTLPKDMSKFIDSAERQLSAKGKSFDFSERNFSKIEVAIKADTELSSLLSDCYLFSHHEAQALLDCQVFLSNYAKYLSSLESEYLKILGDLNKKYQLPLLNIYRVKNLVRSEDEV
ncbi:hypothetical protein [Ferruginibacter sp.]